MWDSHSLSSSMSTDKDLSTYIQSPHNDISRVLLRLTFVKLSKGFC